MAGAVVPSFDRQGDCSFDRAGSAQLGIKWFAVCVCVSEEGKERTLRNS